MLSHFGYANRNGKENTGVELKKNMKLEVACAFQKCGGMALVPLEPVELHKSKCNMQSKEPTCQL